MARRRARRALTRRRDTFTMERPPRPQPRRQPPPDFHPYYFTRETPHVKIEDGYQRPYRSPNSWFEIENGIGWAEYRAGSGGGLGSDRHTDRLMDGIGWAGALAFVLVPGLFFPPWLVIGGIMLILSVLWRGIEALAESEEKIRAREQAEAAYLAQMPNPQMGPSQAFPGGQG